MDESDEFRFAKDSDSRILQKRELFGNYRVIGVDHEGNPFRMSYGLWKRLKLATEEDFRRCCQQSEINQNV